MCFMEASLTKGQNPPRISGWAITLSDGPERTCCVRQGLAAVKKKKTTKDHLGTIGEGLREASGCKSDSFAMQKLWFLRGLGRGLLHVLGGGDRNVC